MATAKIPSAVLTLLTELLAGAVSRCQCLLYQHFIKLLSL
jgi:hypothetical protein